MDENYTFNDLDPLQNDDILFDKHVTEGHPHLIEIDKLLSKAFGGSDMEDL